MLHIFRADNGEERSLHADTHEGLGNAVQEAYLRSTYTGVIHHVVDDKGEVLAILDANHRPKLDDTARKVVKSWQIPMRIFWISAVFVALVLSGAFR